MANNIIGATTTSAIITGATRTGVIITGTTIIGIEATTREIIVDQIVKEDELCEIITTMVEG